MTTPMLAFGLRFIEGLYKAAVNATAAIETPMAIERDDPKSSTGLPKQLPDQVRW